MTKQGTMELIHLKHTGCPTCGVRVTEETQGDRHTNGQWFETMTFECGCNIEWSPNFSKQRTVRECPKDPAQKEICTRRKAAGQGLLTYLETITGQVDEAWLAHARREIENLIRYFGR